MDDGTDQSGVAGSNKVVPRFFSGRPSPAVHSSALPPLPLGPPGIMRLGQCRQKPMT
jgi:hypothetical protein